MFCCWPGPSKYIVKTVVLSVFSFLLFAWTFELHRKNYGFMRCFMFCDFLRSLDFLSIPCAAHVPPRCRGGRRSVSEYKKGFHAELTHYVKKKRSSRRPRTQEASQNRHNLLPKHLWKEKMSFSIRNVPLNGAQRD